MRISSTPRDTNLCVDSGSLVPGSSCVRRAPRNQQRCLRRSKHTQKTHTHVTSQFPSAPALIHTCAVRESQTLLTEHTTTVDSLLMYHWDETWILLHFVRTYFAVGVGMFILFMRIPIIFNDSKLFKKNSNDSFACSQMFLCNI